MIPVQRPCLGAAELAAVSGVFESRWLGMGKTTAEFESRLRQLLGVKHVIAVSTGTAALHVALAALELKPEDEVLVPSLTFVATPQAILAAGARPIFCEVYPDTLTLDTADARRRVTSRTRMILPVHYGGLAHAMEETLELAREHGLAVVEDAAHAFGSCYHGRKVGTIGDVTCFSFDPIKNITCGEGGAVVTDRDDVAARSLPKRLLGLDPRLADPAKNKRWWAPVATNGYRYHMSNINAAIGLVQLGRLEEFRSRKRAIVRQYDEAFQHVRGLTLLKHNDETFPFFYVVRVGQAQREIFRDYLKRQGIETGVHYVPNHLQPLFAARRQALPVTEQLFREIVTLPLFFEMTDTDVATIIDGVRSFFVDRIGA